MSNQYQPPNDGARIDDGGISMRSPSKAQQIFQNYQAMLNKKEEAPAKKEIDTKAYLGKDLVMISPDARQTEAASKSNKEEQQQKFQSFKNRMAIKIGLKQLIAKSSELYFYIDNTMTFDFLNKEVDSLVDKLINKLKAKASDVMAAKLDGKNIARVKVFETLAIMTALEPLLRGKKKNKKVQAKFEVKMAEMKTKLSMLGYEINEEDLVDSALLQGNDFLDTLKEKLKDVDQRLSWLGELKILKEQAEERV